MAHPALAAILAGQEAVRRSVERRPAIDIAPALAEFCGQRKGRHDALFRAGNAISQAAVAGTEFAAMLRSEDFVLLRQLVAFIDGEFALAGIARRDIATDQQFSPNETDYRDQERM